MPERSTAYQAQPAVDAFDPYWIASFLSGRRFRRQPPLASQGGPFWALTQIWRSEPQEGPISRASGNVGGHDAYARVAHLICELHARMGNVGLVTDGKMSLPLTQTDMGEALGLTPVHVNRMLRQLRLSGLIVFNSFQLTILDLGGLVDAAGFCPGYLHGKRPERTLGHGSALRVAKRK